MALTFTTGNTFSPGDTVTATKLNNVVNALTTSMATAKILGRTTAGTGAVEEVATVGSGTNVPLVPGNGQYPFPATQNASADANTLDDYEEGTWTPSVGGTATYTTQTGTYTKIGRQVTAHCRLVINAIGTGNTSVISGLPFAASFQIAGVVGYFASAASNFVFVGCYADGSTVQITTMGAAAASTSAGTAFFGNGTDVMLTVTYHV